MNECIHPIYRIQQCISTHYNEDGTKIVLQVCADCGAFRWLKRTEVEWSLPANRPSFRATDWKKLAISEIGRCQKGQCRHFATGNAVGYEGSMYLCDGCWKDMKESFSRFDRVDNADILNQAWIDSGEKCRYCGEE